jgi:hypothetical protein
MKQSIHPDFVSERVDWYLQTGVVGAGGKSIEGTTVDCRRTARAPLAEPELEQFTWVARQPRTVDSAELAGNI